MAITKGKIDEAFEYVAPALNPPIDLMIDAETLGTRPHSVILNFAVVQVDFAAGKLGQFIRVSPIDINSCQRVGMKIDGNTVDWWLNRPKATQFLLDRSKDGIVNPRQIPIKEAARVTGDWITSNFPPRGVRLWGNSARFDLGLMANMFLSCGFSLPWHFRDEMCYRTISSTFPQTPAVWDPALVGHDCYNDAVHQARHLLKINEAHSLNLHKR